MTTIEEIKQWKERAFNEHEEVKKKLKRLDELRKEHWDGEKKKLEAQEVDLEGEKKRWEVEVQEWRKSYAKQVVNQAIL
jgi:hypothetical protein